MQCLYNLQYLEIAKIKSYPQSKIRVEWKEKATIFAGKSFQRARRTKEKNDIVSQIYFSLVKASALYCNLLDSKHLLSINFTLKLIYPQATFFSYLCIQLYICHQQFILCCFSIFIVETYMLQMKKVFDSLGSCKDAIIITHTINLSNCEFDITCL